MTVQQLRKLGLCLVGGVVLIAIIMAVLLTKPAWASTINPYGIVVIQPSPIPCMAATTVMKALREEKATLIGTGIYGDSDLPLLIYAETNGDVSVFIKTPKGMMCLMILGTDYSPHIEEKSL